MQFLLSGFEVTEEGLVTRIFKMFVAMDGLSLQVGGPLY